MDVVTISFIINCFVNIIEILIYSKAPGYLLYEIYQNMSNFVRKITLEITKDTNCISDTIQTCTL